MRVPVQQFPAEPRMLFSSSDSGQLETNEMSLQRQSVFSKDENFNVAVSASYLVEVQVEGPSSGDTPRPRKAHHRFAYSNRNVEIHPDEAAWSGEGGQVELALVLSVTGPAEGRLWKVVNGERPAMPLALVRARSSWPDPSELC